MKLLKYEGSVTNKEKLSPKTKAELINLSLYRTTQTASRSGLSEPNKPERKIIWFLAAMALVATGAILWNR